MAHRENRLEVEADIVATNRNIIISSVSVGASEVGESELYFRHPEPEAGLCMHRRIQVVYVSRAQPSAAHIKGFHIFVSRFAPLVQVHVL